MCSPASVIQWLWIENGFLHLRLASTWNKNVFSGRISFYLDWNWAPTLFWTIAFEFLKIHQPKVEILQFKGSKFCSFLPVFQYFDVKTGKIKQNLLPSNCNISNLGWWIFSETQSCSSGKNGSSIWV